MPSYVQNRYGKWDTVLAAIQKPAGDVTLDDRALVEWFIEQTPGEDEWLARTAYIDGSPALLMRSMLTERGTEAQRLTEPLLPRVREALIAFAGMPHDTKDAFPKELLEAAKVSILFWKEATMWGDRIVMELGDALIRK